MKRKVLKYLIFFTILLLISIITAIVLYTYTPVVDRAILNIVDDALGKKVKFKYEKIEGNLVGNIRLINVTIDYQNISFDCPQVLIQHSSGDLLSRQINIGNILIESPRLTIIVSAQQSSEEKADFLSQVNPESLRLKIDLSGLPVINIRQLLLKNGSLKVMSEDQTKADVQNISLEMSTNINDEKVDLILKYLKGFWEQKNISLSQLSFQLTGNKKRLTLNQFITKIDNNEIYAHGEIELFPRLRFLIFADTSLIDINLVNKLIPDFPYSEGFVQFYLEYIGVPSNFQGNIFVSSQLDSMVFRKIHAKYRYQSRVLELQDIIASTNFGTVGGRFTVAPEGRNSIYLTFDKINFKTPRILPVKTNIDGWIRLNFNTWNLETITGSGSSQFTEIHYGNIRMDSLFLNLAVADGYWNLKEGSRLVVENSSKFFVKGEMSKNRILDLDLTTDNNVLDTLSSRLVLGDLGGLGHLKLNIQGPLRNPDVSGNVLLDSLTVEKQKSYGVEGDFEITGISQQRTGYFFLEMASGEVLDIYLTDGVLDLKIDRDTLRVDSASFYNDDNYVTLKGDFGILEDYLSISVYDFIFQYQDYRIFTEDSLLASFQNDSLIIEDFVLNATGEGEIEVRGMYDLDGESGLGIYFNDIKLLPFNQFIRMPYPMRGVVDISVTLSGYPDSLMVDGLLEMQNLVLGNDSIGDIWSNFSYVDNQISLEKFDYISSPESYLSLTGNLRLPSEKMSSEKVKIISNERINLDLEFKNIQLSNYPFFSNLNYPFDGIFSGDLEVRGTTQNFSGTYSLNARSFEYREFEIESIDLNGTMLPEGIVLERGVVDFLGTSIRLRGQKPLNWEYENLQDIFSDKRIDLKVTIKDDSLRFLQLLTPEVDLLAGEINIYLDISGDYDSPKLINGLLEVSDGTLYLAKVENPLTNFQFSATVDKEILKIRKCKATTSGYIEESGFLSTITDVILYPVRKLFIGRQDRNELAIRGEVDFSNMLKPKIDLNISANQIYVHYFLENTELLLSVKNLKIFGQDTIAITGDVTIHKGEVDLDLKESEKNQMLATSVRETAPFLQYYLSVSIPGNFYIRSEALFNSFDMMLMGDIQIIQEPKGLLEIYGNLEVPKGKYFQFEEFRIRNGRIEFINPKELPKLNIFAEKNKYGYLFQLHVEGSLNNPIKEIRIFDPNTREDITHLYPETKDQIALLLFGMTFNEIGGSAGSVALGKGQEVINEAIISKIEQEARRFIGLDEVRVESEGGLIDFTNLRLNQMSKNSAVSLGKYLMPNLYIEYKTQLGTSGVSSVGGASTPKLDYEVGNQVYLEYRINRNWSVSSFYAKQLYDKFKIDISWRYTF